ncbi:hypothetical protein BT63DRAFT_190618 [Microthyrium microscopicum]|uniref:Uncharacterized protein n=1 Tax=Microthyrium microscopicum TaxID=703497 RepID=A0A6A6UKC3_9PEZI|nr:hypothetical protein BT63DRAFT_190618 [Microthyrium microscopicum]
MPSSPKIQHPLALPALLNTIITEEGPTTLIICLSRTTFIRHLLNQLPPTHTLFTPTLDLLSNLNLANTRLVFCPSVPALLAYLSTLCQQNKSSEEGGGINGGRLMLAYPLALHAHTSSWSAQGLSQTAAALVMAGRRTGMEVVVVEPVAPHNIHEARVDDYDDGRPDDAEDEDVWKQRVPILSASSTKSGDSGRPWVGRTVETGQVFRRWFRFTEA